VRLFVWCVCFGALCTDGSSSSIICNMVVLLAIIKKKGRCILSFGPQLYFDRNRHFKLN